MLAAQNLAGFAMKCRRCQHENRPQAKFCEECGNPLARACPNCGAALSAMAKFCPECAHPVASGLVPQPRFASPQSYTPKHLAEKILISKNALEGERKPLTNCQELASESQAIILVRSAFVTGLSSRG